MGLEHKINLISNNFENKPGFLNRIRKSLVGKIAAYSLAGALAFGNYACKKAPPYVESIKEPQKIAFISDRDGNSEIYIMNINGSNQTNLTNNPARDSYLNWSLDGSKIAFISDRDGDDEIYVMNSDGSNQINLTNNSTADGLPSWSPK